MNLRQLTIHNLASIEDAVIHFDAPPLADSEVFLITGKTGSGKSTILDAICLALYADTPRLFSTNMQGNTSDQGKEVKVDDPRQLMRRNTGEAYVSLTFMGSNGLPYEARWTVARARNKVNGNLQAKKWTLTNTATGFTYSKDEEIRREIKEAIGLDFKQFCRTTMLAQGEFTRFLNSKDDEKAEILEKITGADIYSRIGERIFAITKSKREEMESAEARISGIRILSEEELAAKRQAISEVEQEQRKIKGLLEASKEKLLWLGKMDELSKKSSSLRSELANIDAQVRSEAFAQERRQLEQWQMTHTARAWVNDLDKARLTLQKVNREQEGLLRDYCLLRNAQQRAADRGKQMAQEAARLDNRLKAEEDIAPTYARSQTIASMLRNAEACAQRAARAAQEGACIEEELNKRLTPQRDEAQTLLARIAQQIQEQQAAVKQAEECIERMRPNELRLAKEERATLTSNLEAAHDATLAYAALLERNVRLRKQLDETAREIATKQKERDTLAVKAHDADVAWQTLQAAHRMESERVSDWAKQMRARLHVGDLCPVCQRPIESELPHEDLLAQMVAESEARLTQAQKERDALMQAQQQAEAHMGALTSSLTTLRNTLNNAQEMARTVERLSTCISRCNIDKYTKAYEVNNKEALRVLARWSEGLPAVTDEVAGSEENELAYASQAQVVLTNLEAANTEAQKVLLAQMAQAEGQEQKLKNLRTTMDDLRQTQEKQVAALQDAEKRVQKCHGELEAKRAMQAAARDEQQKALEQVATMMPAAQEGEASVTAGRQWRTDWHTAPETFALELEQAAQAYDQATKERDMLAQAQETLAVNCRNLESALHAIASMMPTWPHQQDSLATTASDLDLDAAIAHANALLGAVSSAKEQERQARLCIEERESLLHEFARQHPIELNSEDDPDNQQGENMEEHLEQMLNVLRRLDSISQDEAEARQKRIDETLQRQLRTQAFIQENDRQMQAHTQARPTMSDEETPSSLKASTERQEQESEALAKRKGALCRDLELDKDNRKASEQLRAQANAKKEEYLRWERLNSILGDATGSKFRKIAQSFVLDSLLCSANTYLRTLTERYSLRVEPGNFVIAITDAYQGYVSRASSTLSGGESFLVSLSLALALSDIGSRLSVDTLFIDEGFGTLSGEPLQNAISTLRSLHSRAGRHVGIISHVEELKESIPVQIQVCQEGYNAVSTIVVKG